MISLRSEITKKVLNYFFLNPEAILYVNELSRQLALDKRNMVKKINNLEAEGILVHQKRGNLKLYSINRSYPLYNEYRKIVMTTVGLEERLRAILNKTGEVKEAYLYGSYAKDKMDTYSDIDLLVIGSISAITLQKLLSKFQKEINREINVTNMDEAEFGKRVKDKNPFITGILKGSYIKLI